jgi:hypothetical protein
MFGSGIFERRWVDERRITELEMLICTSRARAESMTMGPGGIRTVLAPLQLNVVRAHDPGTIHG